MWLVVGLGNPGRAYARTRHNAGFMVVDLIAARWGAGAFREKLGGELTTTAGPGGRVVLLRPSSYMNLSGPVVARAVRFYDVGPEQLVVVHDDLDLDFGRVKVKEGGGHGGHNGLRSIFRDLGTRDFLRVRVGVGRPPPRWDAADYVLQKLTRGELEELEAAIDEAADAVEMVLRDGVVSAMNRFNIRPSEVEQ